MEFGSKCRLKLYRVEDIIYSYIPIETVENYFEYDLLRIILHASECYTIFIDCVPSKSEIPLIYFGISNETGIYNSHLKLCEVFKRHKDLRKKMALESREAKNGIDCDYTQSTPLQEEK